MQGPCAAHFYTLISDEQNRLNKVQRKTMVEYTRIIGPHPNHSPDFSCPWLVYNSMVKTTKPFLRDATECSAYALLLFGGDLDVEARNSVISIDGWVKLPANARIGALIRGLCAKMDNLLGEKIKDPMIDI